MTDRPVFLPKQHLNENLAKLTAKFEKATADKLKCQQEAEMTAGTISLANRLVSVGLSGLSRNYISRACQVPPRYKIEEHSLAPLQLGGKYSDVLKCGGGGGGVDIKTCWDAETESCAM